MFSLGSNNIDQKSNLRDLGPYSARNASKGALLEETAQILEALVAGNSLEQVRKMVVEGQILHQRARATRETIWYHINRRLFANRNQWIFDDIVKAFEKGSHSSEFISLIYLHYALHDHLSFDFVTQLVWNHCNRHLPIVSRDDVYFLLDQAAREQTHISKWTEASKSRLTRSILAALRDFGLFKGKAKKEITQPRLPLFTAEHLLRILSLEGLRGNEIIYDLTWRLYLLSPNDVAHILLQLSQERRIRFEKVGDTVVLELPSE